jgi:hypothetical protein
VGSIKARQIYFFSISKESEYESEGKSKDYLVWVYILQILLPPLQICFQVLKPENSQIPDFKTKLQVFQVFFKKNIFSQNFIFPRSETPKIWSGNLYWIIPDYFQILSRF